MMSEEEQEGWRTLRVTLLQTDSRPTYVCDITSNHNNANESDSSGGTGSPNEGLIVGHGVGDDGEQSGIRGVEEGL